jgi:hypothetical protein
MANTKKRREKEQKKCVDETPIAKPPGVMKGKKRQISLTISPPLLAKVDALAKEMSSTRATIINIAIYRAVEHGIVKE